MKVRGHCLVWHQYNPEWLTQGHFTAAQLSPLLQEHIATVMKHYSGGVSRGMSRTKHSMKMDGSKILCGTTSPASAWLEKTLPTWSKVFAWAHEADPHALLFYNEAEGEGLNRKSDTVYTMVKDFKHRGVPIDGVGLQLHISRLAVDTAAIASNIARLTALGVQVHITELDVSLPVNASGAGSSEDLHPKLTSIAA